MTGPHFPFSHPHRLSTQLWNGCRIGLLGGSFNPAHEGHYYISLLALRLLELDQIWWMVSPQNPLKSEREMASFGRRMASAESFTRRHPKLLATSIETELGTRYTAKTLAKLHKLFPQTAFIWLMGTDNLAQIPHWRDWQKIFRTTPVAVLTRTSYAMGVLNGKAAKRFRRMWVPAQKMKAKLDRGETCWTYAMNFPHPASATAIRQKKGWLVTDDDKSTVVSKRNRTGNGKTKEKDSRKENSQKESRRAKEKTGRS